MTRGINLNIGDITRLISPTQLLILAELVAAAEAALGGVQTLKIGVNGNAVGGRFSLTGTMSKDIGNLVVPQHVKLFENFAYLPTLNISGNFTDAGKVFAFPTNGQVQSATIDANNIFVQTGGVLTSNLPAGNLPSALGGAVGSLHLNLNVLENIVNQGTISSSGNLVLTAGGSIVNSGSSVNAGTSSVGAHAVPVISASGNLSLYSQSGSITNSGLVQAMQGNITLGSQSTSDLTVNGTKGTFSALNGAINLRDASYSGAANTTLSGGNYLSQQLNLNGGTGSVAMDADQVSGVVNTYAGSAHLNANTADLQIGAFQVSGDPTVSNNSGNVDLSTITPDTYLVVTAGESIYTSVAMSIDTSSNSGNGGNVVLAAGVTATDNSGAISLTRSGMGGDIYLTTGTTIDGNATQNITGFNTSTSNAGSSGGNVTLIAMSTAAGSSSGGHISLPAAVEIDTKGAGSGANGNVTIIGEATEPVNNTVSIGNINNALTVFGTGGGGNIIIKAATANLAGATISDSDGSITGSFDDATFPPCKWEILA